MEPLLTTVLTALVSSLVGAVVASLRMASSKERAAKQAERKALRTLLRNELVQMHREWAEEHGFITLEALQYAEETYSAYHDLGGNGSGTKLWEDMKALPVKR